VGTGRAVRGTVRRCRWATATALGCRAGARTGAGRAYYLRSAESFLQGLAWTDQIALDAPSSGCFHETPPRDRRLDDARDSWATRPARIVPCSGLRS
jgi:hypothetical protein